MEHTNANNANHFHPNSLERYAFQWSLVRLVIASLALFVGGTPIVYMLNPFSFLYGLIGSLLTLAWVISGVSAGYLLYRWNTGGRVLFGKKESKDLYAFMVMVVTGLHLGIAGVAGINIGLSIIMNRTILGITGILYLVVAFYLHTRWKASGERLFIEGVAKEAQVTPLDGTKVSAEESVIK